MKLLKRITSKKGQISMEIGILLFSSILISTVASYYYISNYLNIYPENIGKVANKTLSSLDNVSVRYINSINYQ